MPEPKKETVRIAVPETTRITQGNQPESSGLDALRILKPAAAAPAANVGKIQPQILGAEIAQTSPGIAVLSCETGGFDSIPRWFCWGLLSISAFTFLIEIWNYTLS
jgi:hypothetical protein